MYSVLKVPYKIPLFFVQPKDAEFWIKTGLVADERRWLLGHQRERRAMPSQNTEQVFFFVLFFV